MRCKKNDSLFLSERRLRAIKTLAIVMTFFLTGMAYTLLPPMIPLLHSTTQFSLAQFGFAFTLLSGARIATVIPAGLLGDRYSRALILRIGTVWVMLGALMIGLLPFGTVFFVGMIFFGFGHGFMDGAANAMIADLYPQRAGGMLNLLHMFFGLGGLIGPLIVGFFIERALNWQAPYLILAGIGLIIFCVLLCLRFEQTSRENTAITREAKPKGYIAFLTVLCSMMFLMVGFGAGFRSWMNTFLEYRFTVGSMTASLVLSLSNAGVMIARLICIRIAAMVSDTTILLVSMGISVVAAGVIVSTSQPVLSMIAFIVVGMSTAPFFPIVIGMGAKKYPQSKGMLAGIFTVSATVGSMSFPALIGFFAEATSDIGTAFLFLPFIPPMAIGFFMMYLHRTKAHLKPVEKR